MIDTLAQLVRDYVGLSAGLRFAEKRGFWDLDEPSPLLKPEEAPGPLVGWPAIDAYWAETRAALSDLSSTCADIVVTPLDEATASVAYRMVWRATMTGGGPLGGAPLAATVRVAAAFRLKPDGWKLFCLVESHVDGVEYMRALYRRAG